MKKFIQLLGLLLLLFPALVYAECLEGDCNNGFGVYIFPEGGQYSGEFAEGEFAAGKQVFADGNRYEGTFLNSTPHGKGTLTYVDGSVYSGQFDMGVISGNGSMEFANKSKYEGAFEAGLFHGKGIYTYSNGSKYDGEFKNGKMDGKGTLYSDGRIYRGEFKEGEHYGKGSITYYDKTHEIGEWQDGKFIVSQRLKAPPVKKEETDKNPAFKNFWNPEENKDFSNNDPYKPPQWGGEQK